MKNILVIKYGALGDVIRTSYILPGLKAKYGDDVNIYWLTSSNAFDLLKLNPYIRMIFTNNDLNNEAIAKLLVGTYFDWIISLDDEYESCNIINRLKYNIITGSYPLDSDVCYTDDSALWFNMGLISRFGKELADDFKRMNQFTHRCIMEQILNISIKEPYFINDINISNKIESEFAGLSGIVIGLNLNAGDRWPSKSLPFDESVKLLNELSELDGVTIMLLGGPDDYFTNQKLKDSIKESSRVIVKSPVPLLEFAAIISNLSLLVSTDSLALHFAISKSIPSVSFYSPTSAAEIDTFNTGLKVLSLSDDYCSYTPFADNSTITHERILEKVKELIL